MAEKTHAGGFGEHMQGRGDEGMKHIAKGKKHKEGAAEVRLVLCRTASILLTLGRAGQPWLSH